MAPSPPRPSHVLRTLLTLAAILPGLLSGLFVLGITGDRRRAINHAIDLWGRWGTRAAGIRLEIDHPRRLKTCNPTVYVLNHRSGVDPIIVCALFRRDIFAIVKHELRTNPILGPAFAFAGVVFIKRGQPDQAPQALAPAVEAIQSGLSLVITPEGTRSTESTLGAFKKGAFHVAMAAGVPVVPIVIANADDVLPFGGWLMRPATVQVSVLEPVSTACWSLETLDEEIGKIHQSFVEHLGP
ncbi:1-acyl-sn-glycerol-3-phosphate acyltransferase [Myxococcota bacterium]|nr:1-acyl-sn-glycerol-3-phosphate acyltransferase [Myxococcota bacterium]